MNPDRRRTVLFLICAVVLLGAGFACGYVYSYNGFYSPESQLDHELIEMDFNTRQLYYANVGRRADVQRELTRQLNGQVAFVNKLLMACPDSKNRLNAEISVKQAVDVLGGHPIASSAR